MSHSGPTEKLREDSVDLIAAFEQVFGPIPPRRYDTGLPDYDVEGPDPYDDPDPDGYEADAAAERMFG